MINQNILDISNRNEFRNWLMFHCETEDECYIEVKRGKPVDKHIFYYLDAIEEALCFGWVDSTVTVIDGRRLQRFSPRRKNSHWTELNKERVRRLEKLGLMNEAGMKVLPKMGVRSFKADSEIIKELKKARVYASFKKLPPLYQRIRLDNLSFYRKRDLSAYSKMLQHTIETAKKGQTFGEWNDYGRLLDDQEK